MGDMNIPSSMLNIASTHVGTNALGPGWRSVVWVQGCPFRCTGCIAPSWLSFTPARLASPKEIAEELLADPRITGITISGGEPMIQAARLADMVKEARQIRDIDVVCFTGYRLKDLDRFADPGVKELLGEIDVLIDGPYIQTLNQGVGLRGSSNQVVHYLSDRLRDYDFESGTRTIDLVLSGLELRIIGIPSRPVMAAVESALQGYRP